MTNQGQSNQNLIDFDVGSAEFTQSILGTSRELPETLLDSEPLHLEQTLQTSQRSRCNSKDSVELEQVLISIDEAKDRSEEEISENNDSYEETLSVLDELDRILSIHDDAIDSEEFLNVEECLRDLDDYLQTFDLCTEDYQNSSDHIAELTDQELKTRVQKLVSRTASLGRNGKLPEPERPEWTTLARNHRFRATLSALRKELRPKTSISQENLVDKPNITVHKSMNSLPKVTDQQMQTNPPHLTRNLLRATTGRVRRKPVDHKLNYLNLDTDLEPLVKATGRGRISGNPHVLYEEEVQFNACGRSTIQNKDLETTPGVNLDKTTKNTSHMEVGNTLNDKQLNDFTQHASFKDNSDDELTEVVSNYSFENGDSSLYYEQSYNSLPSEQSSFYDETNGSRRPTLTAEERELNRLYLEAGKNSQAASLRSQAGNISDTTAEGIDKTVSLEASSDSDASKSVSEASSVGLLDPAKNMTPISQEELSEVINNIRFISDDKLSREPHRLTNSLIRNSMRHLREFSEEPKPLDQPSSSWLRSSMRRITSLPNVEDPKNLERPSTSWLRSSMRRIRHFRLPSDPTPEQTPEVQVEVQPQARPFSAPVRVGGETQVESVEEVTRTAPRSSSDSSRSRRARSLSSSESSLASSVDSMPTCTPVQNTIVTNGDVPNNNTRRQCERGESMPDTASPLGQWPHSLSSMLACMGCTLGLFNVCRFATLSTRFGANFILQFLLLSFVFGIPLFTLQLCLGQQLGAGVIDMWRISPLFQGVGVALLLSQALIGIYSIVGVSWIFIYFRDSFITKTDVYRWAQPFDYYRDDTKPGFNTTKISETVPDYLSGVVLQRHNLSTGNSFGAIKFQVAFNLAVVWMIVFVSLSKGLRSYAKVVYVFSLLPIFGTFVLCAKLLGMTPSDSLHEVFPETSWSEFFLNTKSWLAASQEAFLTWGLLGAAVMQLASHNKHRHLLQRDSSLIIILTITILMLTAFLANTCIEILHSNGYNYMPDSFERMSSYVFLRPSREPLPPSLASTPVRYMSHSSFVLGERVLRPGMDRTAESGYQVLRFATELVPATLAILGPTQISPFWAVLFYFVLILFGIAQQLALWHCVITGIMAIKSKVLKSWETTITFFSCMFGFILGLPMTTELGIYVVYFLDYCIGGCWWLVLVYLVQVVAVFMVRGRPYSGDTVVTALFTSASSSCVLTWLAPLLSFTWNVILPVALMVVCITQFRTGNFRELFIWHHGLNVDYWPTWTRQVGSMLQLLPIMCIPVVALIQSYRYLNNGPPDILERIQLLYRPPLNSEHLDDTLPQQAAATNNAPVATVTIPAEDPPPKYTPPPSYTTATGARIAKLLRQSIRRSVRRITSVLGESSVRQERTQLPPPDYSAVLVEMNQSNQSTSNHERNESRTSRELASLQGSTLTAADVASILRSSFRRSTIRTLRRNEEVPGGSLSNQNLVDGMAPLGIDSLFNGNNK